VWPYTPPLVTLYLSEGDVDSLLGPEDALEAIEACFRRMAAGAVENRPRYRLRLDGGRLAVMSAADLELGYSGVKSYAAFGYGDARFIVLLFETSRAELAAVIDANGLGQLRTGAASGVAARHLARGGARTLGVIGCGWQAESQVACVRAAVPTIERVVAYCRTEERLREFCRRVGAEPAATHRDVGEQDVVVTVTTSRDPVLRGEWLRPGALVCAVGANDPRSRELDNVVLERASFVCCDSLEQARIESGDLIEPVQAGVLDWLEVHELHEVVVGETAGRHDDGDIVVFKSNGIAAWDVAIGAAALARARDRGVGREL
jgi:alanine dehydrogenase